MRFYIAEDAEGTVIACRTTKCMAQAAYGAVRGYWVDVPVTAESIRLLLEGQGGYSEQTGGNWEKANEEV